jgi:cytochrome c biogenesis protein CcmG/thiol:disulfide interchange protein DsbE
MRKHFNRFTLPVIAFVSILPVLFFGLDRDKSVLPSPLIGKNIPEFLLPSLQDQSIKISSSDLKGTFILFNVWATWCAGCHEEHAFLMDLSTKKNIPIIGLNWRDNRNEALQWINELGNPYKVIAEDRLGRVAIDWGVYGAPETFLVNPDGIIIHKHLGPLNQDIWDKDFSPYL